MLWLNSWTGRLGENSNTKALTKPLQVKCMDDWTGRTLSVLTGMKTKYLKDFWQLDSLLLHMNCQGWVHFLHCYPCWLCSEAVFLDCGDKNNRFSKAYPVCNTHMHTFHSIYKVELQLICWWKGIHAQLCVNGLDKTVCRQQIFMKWFFFSLGQVWLKISKST